MDDITGIVSALAVILLGLALFMAVALRRKRTIEAGGYIKVEHADEVIGKLTRKLFEVTAAEVYRREDTNGQSWLVFVDTGSSEGSGCVMLVYQVGHDDWPAVVAIRSGRRIPKIFRWLSGGLFKWAEPMTETEASGFAGTGWFVYKEPNKNVPEDLKRRLCEAARGPHAAELFGIALIDSYFAIWCDTEQVTSLLANAPLVRAAFLKQVESV
jgi:hypothetical protein